jgi:methionyl-tRNA formyltransferase
MDERTQRVQKRYLVLGCKPWNRHLFVEELRSLPGRWDYLDSPVRFTLEFVRKLAPRYVFFLHWSWKVPDEIVEQFECVCFHMTDVPYGRGGSPLQNLILRGHRETRLTALRMSKEFDAGPVYLKEPLSLEGGAEEIYLRAGRLSAKMIQQIIQLQPQPQPQRGRSVTFKRRKPEESELGKLGSLEELHDFIRMLDAEGYPRAFMEYGGFRFEFSRSALYDGRIVADVNITRTAPGRETRK